MSTEPFDAESRREILEQYAQIVKVTKYRTERIPFQQLAEFERQYREIVEQYKRGVPILPLSRCPFCQTINSFPIDTFDLDGLWWAGYEYIYQGERCFHYWTLSGAVSVSLPIIYFPNNVPAGPDVPFVIPHILQHQPIRAVIFSLPVGKHTAYPIVYYSEVKPMKVDPPFPYWRYWSYRWTQERLTKVDSGEAFYSQAYRLVDFSLAPWIEQGKVSWIAPGDESMTLRSDVGGCPYLNLPGEKEFAFLQMGNIYRG
jgi:hypothetical protein